MATGVVCDAGRDMVCDPTTISPSPRTIVLPSTVTVDLLDPKLNVEPPMMIWDIGEVGMGLEVTPDVLKNTADELEDVMEGETDVTMEDEPEITLDELEEPIEREIKVFIDDELGVPLEELNVPAEVEFDVPEDCEFFVSADEEFVVRVDGKIDVLIEGGRELFEDRLDVSLDAEDDLWESEVGELDVVSEDRVEGPSEDGDIPLVREVDIPPFEVSVSR